MERREGYPEEYWFNLIGTRAGRFRIASRMIGKTAELSILFPFESGLWVNQKITKNVEKVLGV